MSFQLITSTVVTWLGEKIVGTERERKKNKEDLAQSENRADLTPFYFEQKSSSDERACHCAWGAAAADQDIYSHNLDTHSYMCTYTSVSLLTTTRQVLQGQAPDLCSSGWWNNLCCLLKATCCAVLCSPWWKVYEELRSRILEWM